MVDTAAPDDHPLARPTALRAVIAVLAALSALLLGVLVTPLLRSRSEPPPVLGELPAFSLVRESGAGFDRDDLGGTTWIVGFVFTRCRMACPLITAAMLDLQARLDRRGLDDVKLLAVTVDPEHDTPELLAGWAAERGVDPRRWVLLSGPEADVRALVVEGFRTAMGDPETVGGVLDIAHSGRLALVDPRGRVRGYFEIDEAGLDLALEQAEAVRDDGG